jgi:group I intron endonuclease
MVNQKNYIGQTVDPRHRWYGHRNDAAEDKPKSKIACAIKKHGNHNFEFTVIASCILPCTCQHGQRGLCQDDANLMEQELIKQYDSLIWNGKGYNCTEGGFNAPKTEEFKQLMSVKNTQRWLDYSDEKKEFILERLEPTQYKVGYIGPNKGMTRPEEVRQKIRESLSKIEMKPNSGSFKKGRKLPEEQRQKLIELYSDPKNHPQYGKPKSEETKRKISETLKTKRINK